MNHPRTVRLVLTGLLVLFAASSGCFQSPQPVPTPPVIVTVAIPVEREVLDYISYTGRTDALLQVNIRARVTGYLDKIYFTPNQEVRYGDPLFLIDPRPYKAGFDRAHAQVDVAQARSDTADRTYTRNRPLVGTLSISQQDWDRIVSDKAEANASLKAAQANLESAKLNLGFTKVISPIDGQVSRNLIDVGNLVTQDMTSLTNIVAIDPIYAYFDVDELTVLKVREMIRQGKFVSARSELRENALNVASGFGQLAASAFDGPFATTASLFSGRKYLFVPVQLGLGNEEGYPISGAIDFIDTQVNPSTGTLKVRGQFPNPKVGDNRVLSPGLYVRVRIPLGQPHKGLLISDRAIGTLQGTRFVYVLNDKNEVMDRPVTTGSMQDGLRVIETGIQPGERIIVNGLQRVRPGVTVDPKIVEMPSSKPAPSQAVKAELTP